MPTSLLTLTILHPRREAERLQTKFEGNFQTAGGESFIFYNRDSEEQSVASWDSEA